MLQVLGFFSRRLPDATHQASVAMGCACGRACLLPAGLDKVVRLITVPVALAAFAAYDALAPSPRLQRGELFAASFARVVLTICTCRGGLGLPDGGVAQGCATMANTVRI
jgi:hypothetical protein